MEEKMMIARLWHGWTTPENADTYEDLFKTEIFPAIAGKGVDGSRGIRLLRRAQDDEEEFITMMEFDSWEAVKQFAGEDYERAYVPPQARAALSRLDQHSRHCEIREKIKY
jgi:heme-degrading monooxygenase HmoA